MQRFNSDSGYRKLVRHRTLCLLACWATASTSAASEADSFYNELDLLSEITLSSTATRLDQNILNTPAPVTVIDREMIDLSGIREIPHLLRLVPGFVTYDVDGSRSGLTNYGMTEVFPGGLEVMVDGRSVYDPMFAFVDWGSLGITVSDIQRIEVVRSSNAASQGSNAFLGSINIITRSTTKREGSRARVALGSQRTREAWLEHNGYIGATDFRFSGNYHRDDGYPNYPNPVPPWETNHDRNESFGFSFIGSRPLAIHDRVELEVGASRNRQEYPDFYRLPVPRGFVDRAFDSSYQLVRWQRNRPDRELQVNLQHQQLQLKEHREFGMLSNYMTMLGYSPEQISGVFISNNISDQWLAKYNENARSDRFDLEFIDKLSATASQRLVWGAGARHDKLRGDLLLGRDGTSAEEMSFRLFSSHEWKIDDQLQLNSGLMYEHNQTVGNLLSPRLAVNYLLNSTQSLRFSATKGQRAPSPLDTNFKHLFHSAEGMLLVADILSGQPVREATIKSLDLGYLGKFRDEQLLLDVRVHQEAIDDYITFRLGEPSGALMLPTQFRTSVEDWKTHGLELAINYRPLNGYLYGLQYAFTRIKDGALSSVTPTQSLEVKNFLPKHNLSLLIGVPLGHQWQGSLMFIHQSETNWLQGDMVEDHQKLNLRLARNWKWGDQSLQTELIYQRPLGDYQEFNYFNQAQERLLFSIKCDF